MSFLKHKIQFQFNKHILSLILALFFSVSTFAAASAPEYLRTKNWAVEKISGTTLIITADVVFYNPNKVKAKLRDLDLDVFLNDSFVGKVLQTNMVKIPGKRSFDIPIRFKFDLKETNLNISNVFALLMNNKFIIDIKGFLKANVFALPFKIKINERQEFSAKDFL